MDSTVTSTTLARLVTCALWFQISASVKGRRSDGSMHGRIFSPSDDERQLVTMVTRGCKQLRNASCSRPICDKSLELELVQNNSSQPNPRLYHAMRRPWRNPASLSIDHCPVASQGPPHKIATPA